ncbi:trf (nucleomorph) [Hemiselmis andersenii]|uniref:Trf n=2 Tax=Hemiselmis andersenii TaxID=464988 RepID=A9BKI4_HEMAN|nr:trf [Hemiselmis andersenii]ABW98155.1 trf [Hemiselmis andersenii]
MKIIKQVRSFFLKKYKVPYKMKKISGVFLDFPTFFSEKSQTSVNFFFRKKSSLIRNFPLKNFIECFLRIGKFSFKPMLGEIQNISDFVIEIVSQKNSNIFFRSSFFLKIQKTIKFRRYLDFEYSSSINKYNLNSKQKKTPKERLRKNDSFFPIDIIPPFFLKNSQKKIKFSFNIYSYFKKIGSSFYFRKYHEKTTVHVLSMDKRSYVFKKTPAHSFIDFQVDLSPNFPLKKKKKNLFFIPLFGIGFISKIFKKRPIWTRKTMENFLPSSLKKYLIKILPVICYRFSGVNPFKKSWIRMGFDPRKIKKSIIYQTLLMKTNKNSIGKILSLGIKKEKRKFKKKLGRGEINFSKIRFDKFSKISKISSFQISDFFSEKLKKFFENIPKKKIFINYLIGWLSLTEFKKMNSLI